MNMTREEIEALDGEELAAAVAGQVMKWEHKVIQGPMDIWQTPTGGRIRSHWRPDRNISQAVEIVARMRQLCPDLWFWVAEWAEKDTPTERQWRGGWGVPFSDKELAPIICRSALCEMQEAG